MTTIAKSPFSGIEYEIYEPSPMLISLVTEETQPEKAKAVRVQMATALKDIQEAEHTLKTRQDITSEQKQILQDRVLQSSKIVVDLQVELNGLLKTTPKSVAEVLRTFVKQCEDLSDRQIWRLGKDADWLSTQIQTLVERDAEQYKHALELFRPPQNSGKQASKQGQHV